MPGVTNRRRLMQAFAAAWPFSRIAAAAVPQDVYSKLGIRPVINFQGTMTTLGASKMPPEVHAAMAEASREYVMLEEVKDKVGERIAKLAGTEAALVTSGAAGAIALATYAALTGTDQEKIHRLPDLTGMKKHAVIQKAHRNGYDHAVRSAGLKIIDVETKEELANALGPDTAIMYFLGGSSHVTTAVGGGPGTLLDDVDRRLRISWAGATSGIHTAFFCLLSLAGLAWLGWRGRRSPVIVAMLVGLTVSLVVNDTPVDVLGYGALGLLALTAWDETRVVSERSEASSRHRALQARPGR